MHATFPAPTPGVASHAARSAFAVPPVQESAVRNATRVGFPAGLKTMVTTSSSPALPNPGDRASQRAGSTPTSTKSPGAA